MMTNLITLKLQKNQKVKLSHQEQVIVHQLKIRVQIHNQGRDIVAEVEVEDQAQKNLKVLEKEQDQDLVRDTVVEAEDQALESRLIIQQHDKITVLQLTTMHQKAFTDFS